jgi:phytoene dehydrogenase-like protein
MHGYFHSIIRCAISHGAVFRTCCPVDEIIIQDGRAMGVRLRETAAQGSKTLWASKAVIAAIDFRQTFLGLVGKKHLDPAFIQKVKDISLKGGSLYVSHFFTHEPLRVRPGCG